MKPRLEAVAAVRAFNRFYTQRVGVLAEQHLETGLTLGQARLLFEAGQAAEIPVGVLRARLGVDPAYLSRTLAQLEGEGLLTRRGSATDARARLAKVTPKGRRKLALLERRSEEAAGKLLEHLSPSRRQRLVAAMREIESLLAGDVAIDEEDPASPDAVRCLRAYYDELADRFPRGFDPAASVSANPEEMRPPAGSFLIVRHEGAAKGCGGVKTSASGIGEIKRMWIDPELRGRGVGKALLEALEERARALGFRHVRLDTSSPLEEAIRLYRRAGYREVEPYNDNTYATAWFEKKL